MPPKKSAAKKSAAKKAPARRRSSSSRSSGGLPDRIFAQVSPRSVGGVPLFQASGVTADNVVAYASEDAVIAEAVSRLHGAGFEVLQTSRTTINIAGSARLYQDVFGTGLVIEDRPVIKPGGVEDVAQFIETTNSDMPGLVPVEGTEMADVIEGVAIEEPRYPMAPNAFAPPVDYWHLDVPGDVSLGINADKVHRSGITGKGVKVMMTDSGWEPHPYFVQRGYSFTPTVAGPGAANPAVDENGHGTAESANIFAVAPDVSFQMLKISFTNTTAGFNAAAAAAPHIISNSWGSDNKFGPLSAANLAMAAAIAAAVANGIIVVFSAGNGHWGFPGQHPDVISAGGVYMQVDGSMRASDYASGFVSNIYAGRQSPDVCGLVGMQPGARYIMLPLPSGCAIDGGAPGGSHPNGDETTATDGWAAISGTSAAAPQLAGVAALMKQACPKLTPAKVRQIMKSTARDVTVGSSHSNTPGVAGPGPDTATGSGLVDAHKAVLSAKLSCLPIIQPIGGVQPITVQPVRPIQPIQPIVPIQPIQPVQPIEPVIPVAPIRPIEPVVLPPPIQPGPADAGGAPAADAGVGLTAEDVAYLEQMIVDSGDDLGL
jgi:subtilisin family serine protease